MRKIKFRGKPSSNIANWLYGDLIQKSDGSMQILSIGDYPLKARSVDHETVGQFTGLKDKNGKEIYEGDVFKLGDKKILYQVIWDDCGLRGKQIGSSSYIGLDYWAKEIEIIGNIYHNPNFL